jgi:hypothetical protein
VNAKITIRDRSWSGRPLAALLGKAACNASTTLATRCSLGLVELLQLLQIQ